MRDERAVPVARLISLARDGVRPIGEHRYAGVSVFAVIGAFAALTAIFLRDAGWLFAVMFFEGWCFVAALFVAGGRIQLEQNGLMIRPHIAARQRRIAFSDVESVVIWTRVSPLMDRSIRIEFRDSTGGIVSVRSYVVAEHDLMR